MDGPVALEGLAAEEDAELCRGPGDADEEVAELDSDFEFGEAGAAEI